MTAELRRQVAEDRYVVDPDVVARSVLGRLAAARTFTGAGAPGAFALRTAAR